MTTQKVIEPAYYATYTHRSQIAGITRFFGGFDQYNKNSDTIRKMKNRTRRKPMTINMRVKLLDYRMNKALKRGALQTDPTGISFK